MIRWVVAIALLFVIAALVVLANGCAVADPRSALYGTERLRCVTDNDAATEARECIKAVDRIYGQDGGVR